MEFDDPDLANLLATEPLAQFVGAGRPVLIAAGDPVCVVWANAAAHALLGPASARPEGDAGDAASANLGRDGDPSALAEHPEIRKLMRAAVRLRPGAPALMQRVRFTLAQDEFVATVRCWRPPGARPVFVIAIPDAPASVLRPPHGADVLAPGGEPNRTGSEPAPAASEAPRRGNVRFVWRSDAEGVLQSVDAVVCQLMGLEAATIVGRRFEDLASTLDLTPAGPLRDALATRATWSRLQVSWPFPVLGKRAPVVLGGLPARDAAQAFDGFRGFGVIHLDEAVDMTGAERDVIMARHAPEVPEAPAAHCNADARSPEGPVSAETHTPTTSHEMQDCAPPSQAAAPDEPALAPSQATEHPQAQTDSPMADEPLQPADQAPYDGEVQGPAGEQDNTTARPAFVAGGGNVVPLRFIQRETAPAETAPVIAPDAEAEGFAGAVAPQPTEPAGERDREPSEGLAGDEQDRAPLPAAVAPQPDEPAPESTGAGIEGDGASVQGRDLPAPVEPERGRPGPVEVTFAANTSSAGVTRLWPEAQAERADGMIALSPAERDAFREIARALGARSHEDAHEHPQEAQAADIQAADIDERDGERERRPTEVGAVPETVSIDPGGAPELASDAGPAASLAEDDRTTTPDAAPDDRQRAELLDRIGLALLVQQNDETTYANDALLDLLDYDSLDEYRAVGAIAHTFRGRDPEALVREAGGGAIPALTRGGDVLALRGKIQTISWNNAPASLYTLHKDDREELTAKLRAMELELRKREVETRELHAILDTATDGVALLDAEGRILSLNRAGQALFGYDQNEVAGEPFVTLFCLESQDAASQYFEGLQSDDVRSVLNDGREVYGRASQGGAIPVFVTIGRIQSSPTPKYCAVLRDVTQWKKAERELRDARRAAEAASAMKSDFLAKISHEVRTPLNAILGFAEVIMHERFGPVGNERYKDYLKDIHASGMHVMSLINDLLDLSKIEAGKLELDFSSVNVNKIVNECVSIMQSQAIHERVVLRLSLAPRLPNVVADERALRQIVLNILSNAVKFNEPGGQVIVSTALTEAGHAVIRIRDTGIGMSEKDVETALEPFRQIATSRASRGTGLGLPLTKALVEANRALFSIKSRKGEGTLVEVAFPPTRVLAE